MMMEGDGWWWMMIMMMGMICWWWWSCWWWHHYALKSNRSKWFKIELCFGVPRWGHFFGGSQKGLSSFRILSFRFFVFSFFEFRLKRFSSFQVFEFLDFVKNVCFQLFKFSSSSFQLLMISNFQRCIWSRLKFSKPHLFKGAYFQNSKIQKWMLEAE